MAYSKNNGPVLLFKTIFRRWNGFLSSDVTDGRDGNGLKVEKLFQLLMPCLQKLPKSYYG